MPKPTLKVRRQIALSDEIIRRLPALGNTGSRTGTVYWDKTLPGFGVRIQKRTRVFVLKLAPSANPSNSIVWLGQFPVVSYEDAKAEAQKQIFEAQRTKAEIRKTKAIASAVRHMKKTARTARKSNRFDASVGHYWVAPLPDGKLGVFWSHPNHDHWHRQVASFQDRNRAEEYAIAEMNNLNPKFSPSDLAEAPPYEYPATRDPEETPPTPRSGAHRQSGSIGRGSEAGALYLEKRTGTNNWHYRRIVPLAVREKAKLTRWDFSLRTPDRTEAEQLSRRITPKLDQFIRSAMARPIDLPPPSSQPYLSSEETAKLMGVTERYLKQMRTYKKGPRHYEGGGLTQQGWRKIVYRIECIEEWSAQRTHVRGRDGRVWRLAPEAFVRKSE